MSAMARPTDDGFWAELVARVGACDLSSRRSNKFDDLVTWLTMEWGLGQSEVVCKYVQHSKNRWNRLREAARRGPVAILLLFEGDDYGDLVARVGEAALVSPQLAWVLALVRPTGGDWSAGLLVHRERTAIPLVLRGELPSERRVAFDSPTGKGGGVLLPPLEAGVSEKLVGSLRALGFVGGEPASTQRVDASEALAETTGLPRAELAFKTIPTTKNLGNRLGEALSRRPSLLVCDFS